MEQPTLTEYYSTKKRPIEGINPAKRRKRIETEAVVISEVQIRRESTRITRQRSTTAPKPTRVLRTRKARTKDVVKATENYNLDSFLSLGIEEVTEESEKVVSEVTSTKDDHETEALVSKATPSSTRRRKAQPKLTLNRHEAKCSDRDIIENTIEKTFSKARRSRKTRKPETKEISLSKITDEIQKLQEAGLVENHDNKNRKDESKSIATKNQTKPKQSIMVLEKSPVRTASSSSRLKINPWIADQANKVLCSRGQAALLLSHQKKVDTCQNSCSRNKSKKAVAEKNGLSKTKAQEGLEKARELIKKMRSLESDSLKSNESSTADTSERLHKLAKRLSTDGASDECASSTKKVPAHERFHSLVQPTPPSSTVTVTLPLPYKYKILGEMFTCCDTILNLLGQRKEACVFDRLKESVQQMCRKRFENSHLAQMVFLYPACYDLHQVRNSSKSLSYQLIIQFGPCKNSAESRMTVSTTELLSRKKTFQDKLLTIAKKHHQTFIQSLETPLRIDDDKITRWHPQFRLDEVLDIENKALPEPPVIKTFTSAQDVLDKGRGFLAPKVEKALKNASLKSKEKTKIEITYDSQPKVDTNNSKTTSNNTKVNNALKGVSQDLLNKIRQKEARKLEEKLMRDPVLDKKMVMQERLPEICRILKTYFTTEKKAAIPLEDATVKLSESYKSSLSPGQVKEHLNLLSEIAPEWMSVLIVRKCPYVKINRKTDINCVIKKVTQLELK